MSNAGIAKAAKARTKARCPSLVLPLRPASFATTSIVAVDQSTNATADRT